MQASLTKIAYLTAPQEFLLERNLVYKTNRNFT
jgi:hypothetical protein